MLDYHMKWSHVIHIGKVDTLNTMYVGNVSSPLYSSSEGEIKHSLFLSSHVLVPHRQSLHNNYLILCNNYF